MSTSKKSAISSRVNSCTEESSVHQCADRSLNASTAFICLASILMASSGTVTAFSPATGSSIPRASRGDVPPVRRKSHRVTASPTSLWYRNGDEDSSVARSATSSRIAATHGSLSSDDSQPSTLNSFFARKAAQRTQDDDNEQFGLDEYLAFLDRRYNRLYGNERGESRSGTNTTMDWLLQRSPLPTEDAARQQEDAQHILGIAGQASKDLLNEQQSSSQVRKPKKIKVSSGVVDTLASIVPSLELEPWKPDAAASPLSAEAGSTPCPLPVRSLASMIRTRLSAGVVLLQKIQGQKDAFVAANRMPKVFIELIRQSLMTVPVVTKNAILAAISIGGGRANVRLAITVAASLLIFLRPIGSATLQG